MENQKTKRGGQRKQTKRSGNFREKKAEDFHASRDIYIREQLFVGCSNSEGALPSVGEVVAKEAIAMPISTRGVGTASIHMAKTVSKLTPAIEVDVRSVYRAGLGLVEARLARQQGMFNRPNSLAGDSLDVDVSNPLIHTIRHIPMVPEPFFRLVNCIGILKHQGDIYLPVLPKELYVRNAFTPRCHTVLLSNLRRTVEVLSDPRTPRLIREEFYNNSPIPGARWEGRRLANPDAIIPPDYDNVAFKRDLDHLNDLAIYLERNLPKMAGGPVDLSSPGNQAQLLSSDLEHLKVPDYTQETLMQYIRGAEIQGNVTAFWSQAEVEGPFRILGALCLLGETPTYLTECFPLYLRRMRECSQYRYKIDTASVTKCIYSVH